MTKHYAFVDWLNVSNSKLPASTHKQTTQLTADLGPRPTAHSGDFVNSMTRSQRHWPSIVQVDRQQISNNSSSRMRVMNHNWSATKQHLRPQSVAEISRHSVLSGDRIRHVRHRLSLTTRTQISVCKSPFPSAGTAVSLVESLITKHGWTYQKGRVRRQTLFFTKI